MQQAASQYVVVFRLCDPEYNFRDEHLQGNEQQSLDAK
jgi:hypothetical protein